VHTSGDPTSKLLLVDLDGTLLDRDAAFALAVAEFVDTCGLGSAAIDWVMRLDGGGYIPRVDVALALMNRYETLTARRPQIMELLDRGGADFVELDPAVRSALSDQRAEGTTIVVVTNGPTTQQEAKLARSGIDKLVDAWVISESAGVRKPDVEMFRAGARRVGAELPGAWMVGDSAEIDIRGARSAGCQTVWVSHDRTWPFNDFAPTHIERGTPAALGATSCSPTAP
jgi:putative hydrolase of the HAD superfamily